MIRFISSQGHHQAVEQGKLMIESFAKAVPNQTLHLYTEDFIKVKVELGNKYPIEIINLKEVSDEEYTKFQEDKHIPIPSRTKRFAHKAWAIMHSLENYNEGLLCWIDADVLFKHTMGVEWVESLVSKNELSAHLGVEVKVNNNTHPMDGKTIYAAETGFFVINLEHKDKDKFLKEYRRSYLERDFNTLRKPFDNDIYGRTIKVIETEYRELSPNLELVSPFNKSVLRSFMYHYKAHHKERMLKEGPQKVLNLP